MRIKSFVLDRSANLKGFPTEIIFVPRWKAIAIKEQIGRKILQLHLRLYSEPTGYKNYCSNNPLSEEIERTKRRVFILINSIKLKQNKMGDERKTLVDINNWVWSPPEEQSEKVNVLKKILKK
jgi:hypothetical protein